MRRVFLAGTWCLWLTLVAIPTRGFEFLQTLQDTPVDFLRSGTVSPDGRHLYTVGDSAISVFDVATGRGLVEIHRDNKRGVEGLGGAYDVVASRDGGNVYVVSQFEDNAVANFARDPSTGKLTFLEAWRSEDGLGMDLEQPLSVLLSPDDLHLYAVTFTNGRAVLAHFVRNLETGELTYSETMYSELVDGVPVFDHALKAVMSSDGEAIYVAGRFGQLGVLQRNTEDGTTSMLQVLEEEDFPFESLVNFFAIELSSDRQHVYVLFEDRSNSDLRGVLVLARQSESGTLAVVNSYYVTDFGLHHFFNLTSLALSGDDSNLYAVTDAGEVGVFSRDAADGSLSLTELASVRRPDDSNVGIGQHVAVGPADESVFVLRRDAEVFSFERSALDGSLAELEVFDFRSDADVMGLEDASRLTMSSDGRHVYVLSTSGVSRFDRADDGKLSFAEIAYDENGGIPRALISSPDQRHLYVHVEHALIILERDQVTGELQRVGPVQPFGVDALGLSPDGRHLYAARDPQLFVFARDPGDGSLASVVTYFSGVDFPDLFHPLTMDFSPDGGHLYFAGDRLPPLLFERDPDSGELQHVEDVMDPIPTSESSRITISGDGKNAYLTQSMTDSLLSYRRDPESGQLTLLGTTDDGLDGNVSASWARPMAESPDGRFVFIADHADNALKVFARDASTGMLSFSEAFVDGFESVEGLLEPVDVVVSPDSRHVYLTSWQENAITAFTRDCLASEEALCLGSGRFRVEVEWSDFAGETGSARDVGLESPDSGLLYFFDPDNWEMLVKVLDGCSINQRYWVYGAATTDVGYELKVTDTSTGEVVRYSNPLGSASEAITDTDAFANCQLAVGEQSKTDTASFERSTVASTHRLVNQKDDVCTSGDTRLCLNNDRFRVEVQWETADGQGSGTVEAFQSSDSGLFWFFSPNNLELLVKVLDGCSFNDHVWVFAAATTDVAHELTVTDTVTGVTRTYANPAGRPAPAIADTAAFASCP